MRFCFGIPWHRILNKRHFSTKLSGSDDVTMAGGGDLKKVNVMAKLIKKLSKRGSFQLKKTTLSNDVRKFIFCGKDHIV